jgi:hypothetical protein
MRAVPWRRRKSDYIRTTGKKKRPRLHKARSPLGAIAALYFAGAASAAGAAAASAFFLAWCFL